MNERPAHRIASAVLALHLLALAPVLLACASAAPMPAGKMACHAGTVGQAIMCAGQTLLDTASLSQPAGVDAPDPRSALCATDAPDPGWPQPSLRRGGIPSAGAQCLPMTLLALAVLLRI